MDPRYIMSDSFVEAADFKKSTNDSRQRILKKDIKKEEPKLPSKAEMAKNVTKSLARTVKSFVSGDGISTTDKEREKRMKECLSCAWYIKEKKRCAKCGCVVALKTYLLEESCPVGKW